MTQRMNTMLRMRDLKLVTKRCKTSLYAWIKMGLLTRPVSLGPRTVAWPADEVNKILACRVAGHSDDIIKALVDQLHRDRQADEGGDYANV